MDGAIIVYMCWLASPAYAVVSVWLAAQGSLLAGLTTMLGSLLLFAAPFMLAAVGVL
jgi:hypothetical protein